MKKTTDEFRKIFGEGKEGFGKMAEGYLYFKWINLYVYHLRNLANTFSPDPELILRYPKEIPTPEVDELTQMAAEKTLPTLLSPETSTYHSKVVKLDDAKALVNVDRDISLTNLETVVPYKNAKDIILKSPDQIAVIDCACRATKENSCEPLGVCMIMGEPFVSLVLENGMNNPRKITSGEAVEILKAEDDRGHIHTAWFKDSAGDRFYAICNCCSCCCAGMRAFSVNVPVIAPSGYVCEISDDCDGCEQCVEHCPFGAISFNGQASVVYEKCMGCGVCESKCPVEAISLKKDPAKGEPLDIRKLMEQA